MTRGKRTVRLILVWCASTYKLRFDNVNEAIKWIMGTSVYNILIQKGETFKRSFRFLHTLELAKDLIPSATAPPTQLFVKQLPVELPVGYVIQFPIPGTCNTIDMVVATTALVGSEVITIAPFTGTRRLRCGTTTSILPINLTGLTWRGAVRAAEDDTTPLITFSFATPVPLSGVVEMSASSALTAEIASNARFDEIPCFYEEPLDIQARANFVDQAVYDAAYFWDLECENAMGEVTRKLYGRCWVIWESAR